MSTIKFYKSEEQVPLEMHKVRVVQKLSLPPVEESDKCDLNRDGEVNAADLALCAKAMMGELVPDYPWDVNEDNRTNVFDVVYMRKIIAKIITAQ